MTKFFLILDKKIFIFINQIPHSGFLKIFFNFIDFLGNEIFLFLFLSLLFLLLLFKKKKKIKKLSILSLSFFLVWGFSFFLKIIFSRERPFETIENTILLGTNRSGYSFPSSHTTAIFGIFFIVLEIFNSKILNLFFFSFAIFISFSRVYLGVHYLSDVIFGGFLGFFGTKNLNKFFLKNLKF